MKGKYYAIKHQGVTPEIQALISEPKYGAVIHLENHPQYECIIEVENLQSPNAVLINATIARNLVSQYSTQDELT